MRKLFLVLGMLCALSLALSSPVSAAGARIGVKAGANLANQTGDAEGASSKLGLAGGVFVELKAGPKVAIQPELLYTQKGSKEESGGIEEKVKLDYIEVPVLLKLKLGAPGVPTSPSIFLGPSLGFLASAKAEVSDGSSSGSVDIKEFMKSTDFSAVFGAGLDVSKLTFDVRYSLGFADISEGEDSIKNGVFSFMVGYFLN